MEVARVLLHDKITGQADVLSELSGGGGGLSAALEGVHQASTLEELLGLEASAALEYWEGWRDLEVPFGARDQAGAPKHWLTFGQRHSRLTSSPLLATNPPNAILNYLYSLLEARRPPSPAKRSVLTPASASSTATVNPGPLSPST